MARRALMAWIAIALALTAGSAVAKAGPRAAARPSLSEFKSLARTVLRLSSEVRELRRELHRVEYQVPTELKNGAFSVVASTTGVTMSGPPGRVVLGTTGLQIGGGLTGLSAMSVSLNGSSCVG